MTRSFGSWRLAFAAALLSTAGLTGCAADVGDVDRTQPDQVDKALFQTDDEWYFRQTVVDTDFQGSSGNAYMFEALESRLKRVRWVVTQDMLYAMSTVNPVDNLTDGLVEEEERRLGVVAAFPITQHFDVQRSYSTSTGEQTNVISENGSDRPWYDRKYMRVDWSRNVADGVGLFSSEAGSFSAKAREIPQEERRFDPHRTRLSEDYIDATTEYFFEPDIYTCFNSFGFESIFNCEAGPVAIRNSFVRIDDTKTYEPLEYLDEVHLDDEDGSELRVLRFAGPNQDFFQTRCDEELLEEDALLYGYEPTDSCSPAKFDMFGRFGYFRTERASYDPARSSRYEEQRRYYANRWNIWQTAYDDEGGLIPLADRTPKPIVYHTNAGFPDHMWDATQRVADSWNETFVESVRLAKDLESTEDAEAAIAAANDGNPRMFQIVRNSCSPQGLMAWYDEAGNVNEDVRELFAGMDENTIRGKSKQGLERMCAELEYVTNTEEMSFEWQRVGDLRYSFFNWVDERVPWLGYGPSAADPLTGEIISGNANFAGETLERYGAIAADYIMFFDGRIPEEELIWGDHVRDYFRNTVETGQSVAQQELSPEERENLRRISPVEIPEVGEGIDIAEVPDFIRKHGPERVRAEADRVVETNMLAKTSDTRLLEFLEQPEVMNRRLQDPNFRFLVEARAANMAGPEYTDADVHQAYVSASAPLLDRHRYERRNAKFGERNMLSLETMEDGMAQVASYIGATDYFANSDRATIERFFMDNIFYSTQLHEIGHTVGLRHNFGASADALNYHDEFWEMRAALAKGELTEEEKWSLSKERAEEIFGHPIDEAYASEAEYREASIMDYGAGLVSGFPGLGKYDNAAIHFAYANKMEVFDESVDMTHYTSDTLLWLGDYTHIPNFFAGGTSTQPASSVDDELEGIDAILNKRQWVSVDEAKLERRNQILANTKNYKNGELASAGIKFDRAVPYEYCDDSFRGSRLNCNVFDFGANQREILQYEFDNYRVFQPYRRYNRGLTNNYYQNLVNYQNWLVGILQTTQQPFFYYSIYQYYDLRSYTDDLREASVLALNFMGEVFAQPEPGDYCLYDEANSRIDEYWYYGLEGNFVPADWDNRRGSCSNKIRIDRGEGNFYNYQFTDDYNYRIRRVGSYIDKYLALGLMFQISGNFAYSTFFTDARASNVSFWTLFQDELFQYVRGIILGDQSGFAGVYNRVTGSYEPPKIVDPKSFGTGLPPEQSNMDRVRTYVGFSEESDAIIYSILYNSTFLDQNVDMVQYMKVCVSNTECQELPPGTTVKEFVHPETNQVYKAPIPASGRSISGDLIDQANILKIRYEEALTDLENSQAGTSAYETNLEVFDRRSRQLEDVIGKLDRIRWVIGILGPDALY